jgi:exopolyphosphatase/guanosine-5'-triphosphate,3'-diphosphate pyrophosphatase
LTSIAVTAPHHGNIAAARMLCACIDIGTNTTRVLVAEARDGRLTEVLQRRAFTRLGRGLRPGEPIPPARIEHAVAIVAEQRALAERAGAAAIRTVATDIVRRAANGADFCAALRAHAGVDVCVLDGEEEARLAFIGATRTLGTDLHGSVGVVDVGGGSTEIAVGTVKGGVEWWRSFAFGSGLLADAYLKSDPPTAAELDAIRAHAAGALAGHEPPPVDAAVAVGGSAASLRRLVGDVLHPASLERALGFLTSGRAADVALRFDLDVQRVRLMPAGLLALDAAARALDEPLRIGRGGVREGVLLDLAGESSHSRGTGAGCDDLSR